ncbi:hypothetical protein BJX96DRAFT_164328 [Aspergillus floccosus]
MKTILRAKPRKVQCPFCSKSFTRSEHLQRHLGSHGVGKAVTCPQCGKDFMRKDVMKRHLDKCRLKARQQTAGDISRTAVATAQNQQSMSNTHAQQQQDLNETLHPSTWPYSQIANSDQPQPPEERRNHFGPREPNAGETDDLCLLSKTPSSETHWNDTKLDDIQFLLDPIFFDRDEDSHSQPVTANAVGVPCIDIDPADTFNFLAGIANKETAPLETRYDCGSLYERQWAGREIMSDGSTSLVKTASEIVQQIRDLSQRSTIMHTWTPQLEKDCIRFFSPKNLGKFIRIYWTSWHPHYPVIHKPTFSIVNSPPHLTAAMATIGACFSANANDRHSVKLWLNSVEEMVFHNKYFGDIMLHDPATINVKDIVRLLQAAHCVCTFQISEGSQVSRRRIRRQRFSMVVSLVRDLDLFNVAHSNHDSFHGSDFCWDSFIAAEECIRTMLFVYTLDTAFTIFSNYPPRTRIQEMSLEMACPEACFQAQSASDCLAAIQTCTSHPLWKCRMKLRDIIQVILCTDVSLDMRVHLSHLGILNLWIVCSALCSEALQINSLIGIDTQLGPMRRAIHNWKLVPRATGRLLATVGVFQNASEYWLLLNILVRRIEEQQRDRHDQSTCPDIVHIRPYTPSRCDSPPMADLKHLILEHHRQFRPYA